jgi:hypothetical protein
MRPTIRVEIESDWRANVSGPTSWELCRRAGRRRPSWSPTSRAWVISERTARDVVAMAEAAGCNVVVTGPRMTAARTTEEDHSTVQGPEPEQGGLW